MRDSGYEDLMQEMLAKIASGLYGDDVVETEDLKPSKSTLPKNDTTVPEGQGPCPICGAPTRRRIGRNGPFYGCTQYPNCKGARNYGAAQFGPGPCPVCGAPTTQRVGKLGLFYGCTQYPNCQGSLDFNPNDIPAPAPPPNQNRVPRQRRPEPTVRKVESMELQSGLRATVPPLPPDLVDEGSTIVEPDDGSEDADLRDWLFGD